LQVHAQLIKVTSSTTTTVIGSVKTVVLLIFTAMLLGETDLLTLRMGVGCVTALAGFYM